MAAANLEKAVQSEIMKMAPANVQIIVSMDVMKQEIHVIARQPVQVIFVMKQVKPVNANLHAYWDPNAHRLPGNAHASANASMAAMKMDPAMLHVKKSSVKVKMKNARKVNV